ncbi:MAG: hypothetical protein KF696_07735 [Planctomycetes bacterium]|nr:hypothetical protein [Planctomycetota bacterium]MCW8135443.1 hypothetical protein [Planctomycetota bacterium]
MKALALLVLPLCVFAAAASAQTYTRTQSTGSYTERTGAGASLIATDSDYDDGCLFVPLPFAFPFFDRTYRGCWMNTNGRIHFSDFAVEDYDITDINPTVTENDLLEAIAVIASDVTGSLNALRPQQFKVFYESGRVVFQWTRVTFYDANEQLSWMSFQCHLFPSGEIRMHMGPATAIINDPENFVSGIVNADGTQTFAGLVNTLNLTSALPANGTLVSLVPSGYMQSSGIVLSPRHGFNYAPKVAFEGETGVVVGSFRLDANGTGGTVNRIDVNHQSPSGHTLTLRLYRDTGTLGVLDGGDVQLGSMALASSPTSFTGLTEVLDGTTPTRHYLLAVDVTSIDEDFESYFFMNLADYGDVGTTGASIWGGYFTGNTEPENFDHVFLEGPKVEFEVSRAVTQKIPVFAGGAERELASFEVRLKHGNGQPVTLNSFEADLINLVDVVLGDVTAVRLYRDNGTPGVLDGADVQIGAINNPMSPTLVFSALSEAITSTGQDYLITIMIGTSYTSSSVGTIGIIIDSGNTSFTPSNAFWEECDSANSVDLMVMPTTAVIGLKLNEATCHKKNLPVFQGATNVPLLHFVMQASAGTQTVTGLNFDGVGSILTAARLYLDHGTSPGRLDAGDTLVATATTLSATNITFTALSESITAAGSRYMVVVDLQAAASLGTHAYSLGTAGVSGSVMSVSAGNDVEGYLSVYNSGSTGVDVTVQLVSPSGTISMNGWQLIARVQQEPRNGGGFPAHIEFELLNAWGGAGRATLEVFAYIEGAGPIGQLDASDYPIRASNGALATFHEIPLHRNEFAYVNVTRNFLIFARVRSDACEFNGRAQIRFNGITGGTSAVYTGFPALPNMTAGVALTSSGGKKKKGGGGGGDGGCSTDGSNGNWLLLMLALSGLVLATRMRRARQ